MRFFWVNQNQTGQHEIPGGYLWSPKRKNNGDRHRYYENMREVAPGDVVFSYVDQELGHVGIAASHCYDAPRPVEFGEQGQAWSASGWRIDAEYHPLRHPLRPKLYMEVLAPLLPEKYSPLRTDGNGLQSVYLAELPPALGQELLDLLRNAGNDLAYIALGARDGATGQRDAVVCAQEDQIQRGLQDDAAQGDTEAEQVIRARRGQGRFRRNVEQFETSCRLTGVEDREFLIASHIKPWRSASNPERLDGENGLLLTPNVDWLFDRGYISFDDEGRVLRSPVAPSGILLRLGIGLRETTDAKPFTQGQKRYLAYHRESIFLRRSS